MKSEKGLTVLGLVIWIIVIFIIFCIFIGMISDSELETSNYTYENYTITFDTDGGLEIKPMIVNAKTYLTPITPEKSGYTFVNWTLNGEFFDFNGYVGSRITSDVTLKAKYKKITFVSASGITDEERNSSYKSNNGSISNNNSSNSSGANSSSNASSSSNNSNNANNSLNTNVSTPAKTESKSSYIASCKDYNSQYADMQRNPNSYKGLKMKFRGMVEQRWSQKGIMRAFTISACTSENRYIGMIYCSIDESVLNGGNLLEYDYVNVYGEFQGLADNLVSIYGHSDYPSLVVRYIELTKQFE